MALCTEEIHDRPCIIGEPNTINEIDESCIEYNLDMLQIESYLNVIYSILLLISVVFDILCYKYRSIANYYLYLNVLMNTIISIIPNRIYN